MVDIIHLRTMIFQINLALISDFGDHCHMDQFKRDRDLHHMSTDTPVIITTTILIKYVHVGETWIVSMGRRRAFDGILGDFLGARYLVSVVLALWYAFKRRWKGNMGLRRLATLLFQPLSGTTNTDQFVRWSFLYYKYILLSLGNTEAQGMSKRKINWWVRKGGWWVLRHQILMR